MTTLQSTLEAEELDSCFHGECVVWPVVVALAVIVYSSLLVFYVVFYSCPPKPERRTVGQRVGRGWRLRHPPSDGNPERRSKSSVSLHKSSLTPVQPTWEVVRDDDPAVTPDISNSVSLDSMCSMKTVDAEIATMASDQQRAKTSSERRETSSLSELEIDNVINENKRKEYKRKTKSPERQAAAPVRRCSATV